MQIRVREDQEAIIASLSPEDYEPLLDLRPFMQVRPCCLLFTELQLMVGLGVLASAAGPAAIHAGCCVHASYLLLWF